MELIFQKIKSGILIITNLISVIGCTQTKNNYDAIYKSSNNFSVVEKDHLFGYINKKGEEVVPLIYSNAYDFDGTVGIVKKEGKVGAIDMKGNVLVPLIYDYVYEFHGTYAVMEKDGLRGFVKNNGEVLFPPQFTAAYSFQEEFGVAVVEKDGKYGLVDKSGEFRLPIIYDHLYHLHENRGIVTMNDKSGYFNAEGEIIIPLIYDFAMCFNQGLGYVANDNHYGFIDTSGQVVVPLEYQSFTSYRHHANEIAYFINGWAVGYKDGKYYYLNQNGGIQLDSAYDFASFFNDKGRAIVGQSDLVVDEYGTQYLNYFIIDDKGVKIKDLPYDELINLSGGLTRTRQNGKYGLLDDQLDLILEPVYNQIIYFDVEHKLIQVEKNGKHGYCDLEERFVIPLEYDYCSSIMNGQIIVKKGGKHGLYNTKHEAILPLEYEQIISVYDKDIYLVELNQKMGFFRGNEKEIEFSFEVLNLINSDHFIARKEGKYGLIDSDENVIIPFNYDSMTYNYNNSTLNISQNNKYGIIDLKGQVVLQPKYDQLANTGVYQYDNDRNYIGYLNLYIATKENQVVLLDSNYQEISQYYDEIGYFNNETSIVKQGKQYGMINTFGKEILPATYDGLYNMYLDTYRIEREGLYGLANKNGEILSPVYNNIDYFSEYSIELNGSNEKRALSKVQLGNKYGIISNDGKLVIPTDYTMINLFDGRFFIAESNNQQGLYDYSGNMLLDTYYDELYVESENMFRVVKDLKIGLINDQLEMVLKPEYDALTMNSYRRNVYVFFKQNKYGVLTLGNPEIQTSSTYDELLFINPPSTDKDSNTLFLIAINGGKAGIIDNYDTVVIPLKYQALAQLNARGEFMAMKDEKWGIINYADKVLCNFKYDAIRPTFANNIILVKEADKFGYINSDFKPITPIEFISAADFRAGISIVSKELLWGAIDMNGEWIIPLDFQSVKFDEIGLVFTIEKDNRFALADHQGELLTDFKYDEISEFNSGIAIVSVGSKYGAIDFRGHLIIDVIYDAINPFYYNDYVRAELDGEILYLDKRGQVLDLNLYGPDYYDLEYGDGYHLPPAPFR